MENTENKALAIMKAHIGHKFPNNPSKLGAWLEGTILEAEEGMLVAEYLVRPEMTNGIGTLHGGAIAAILDDQMGATIVSLGAPNFYTTVNLIVDYFYPSVAGDVVTAKTSMVKRGKQIQNVQCELWNLKTNKLLAKGTSNLLRIDVPVKHSSQG